MEREEASKIKVICGCLRIKARLWPFQYKKKALKRQGVKLDVNVCGENVKRCEDFQRLDEVSENSSEESQWTDELSMDISKFEDKKMSTQRGGVFEVLPEELVERILAMLPYPFVFQARVLSKSWLARLSSISSQNDEDSKNLAISFQKRISEQSVGWKTLCPVHYCPGTALWPHGRPFLHAFDRTSLTWLKLPSLSFLPWSVWERVRESGTVNRWVEQIEGALVLLSRKSFSSNVRHNHLIVANILTRSWKELPPRPHGDTYGKTYLCHLLDKYKLILMPETDHNLLEIYDSTSAAWTGIKAISSLPNTDFYKALKEHKIASLNGIVYFGSVYGTVYDQNNPGTVPTLKVLAINVNEETLAQQFDIVAEVMDMRWREATDVRPVICNANLLIVMVQIHWRIHTGALYVVKIDLESGQCLGVFSGPPTVERMKPDWVPTFSSDGDLIFTLIEIHAERRLVGNRVLAVVNDVNCILKFNCLHRVLVYNVPEDRWALFPYERRYGPNERRIGLSFRPGLNPFVAV